MELKKPSRIGSTPSGLSSAHLLTPHTMWGYSWFNPSRIVFQITSPSDINRLSYESEFTLRPRDFVNERSIPSGYNYGVRFSPMKCGGIHGSIHSGLFSIKSTSPSRINRLSDVADSRCDQGILMTNTVSRRDATMNSPR